MKQICHCGSTLQFSGKQFAHKRTRRCDLWEWQTPLDDTGELFYPAGWDRMSSNERDAWEASSKVVGEL